ncbi:RidA family protein [Nocardiopsis sp. HUAS JQ3]|uniref:RidA family protein n=1 Tax=Nocardiopsis sp. HUAS JQ3 TaxID=3061629 RepID=UPI0023A9280C|nr:RidA family protein [Nocardiopsis sp. HUAS JQ3]WDZ93081.1 RidA family protein [Nocardiopsis sp. HUAS JQ3]
MGRTPHEIVNPLTLAEPSGSSHALVVSPGRVVHVGGQRAYRPDGRIVGTGLAEQFDRALANAVEALRAAGAEPAHVVDMRVFTTSMAAYRAQSQSVGAVYRRHMGRFHPPMTVLGVVDLLDPDAVVEVVCTAVVPDAAGSGPLLAEQVWKPVEEEGRTEVTVSADGVGPLPAQERP